MTKDKRKRRWKRHERAAAAGAGAAVGGIIGHLPGAIVGAALGPLLDPFMANVFAEWRSDGIRRAEQMLASASEASGLSGEQLAEALGATEQTRLQAAIALAAATRTAWDHKVRTLGRVLVEGVLATDQTIIDTEAFVLQAVAEMERLHVSLLDLLVGYEQGGIPFKLKPNASDWQVGNRLWTDDQIVQARPQLKPVLPSLTGSLSRLGLIAQKDLASTYPEHMPVPLMWSPTPLGEQVLDYYREAGSEPGTEG